MPTNKGHRQRGGGKLFQQTHNANSEPEFAQHAPLRPNVAIQNYFTIPNDSSEGPSWIHWPEIPTYEDLMEPPYGEAYNKIDEPWDSKEEYLRSHYILLREEALRRLRTNINVVQQCLLIQEDKQMSELALYENVHICGATLSQRGLGVRVSFSLGRVGKKIRWEQSKRLQTGSLVVLMSMTNKDVCKVAAVAGRPLNLLEKTIPEIDLFFSRSEDVDLDPRQEWLMIEDRSALFEAQRHVLVALQRMQLESFPLQEHLVRLETEVESPDYLRRQPIRLLGSIFTPKGGETFDQVNVLNEFPQEPGTPLDTSQLSALQSMITKKLSVVQGPPGTGKTFVSVQALTGMIDNLHPGDPPIIVSCQTNHALDQLLRHVAVIEPRFVRLGGRSKDTDVIKKRTLFELRREIKFPNSKGIKAHKMVCEQLSALLAPFRKEQEFLDAEILQTHGLLSEEQLASLQRRGEEWVTSKDDVAGDASNDLTRWVQTGKGKLVKEKHKLVAPLLEYEDVEDDDNFEEIQELDAEAHVAGANNDDEEHEALKGEHIEFGDMWVGTGARLSDSDAAALLEENDDLWDIRSIHRGAVYNWLQKCLRAQVSRKIRDLMPQYRHAVQERRIANLETAEMIVRNQRVVGLTTTGLAKNRALIASLKPKVVFIEEAAETLEAPVAVACMESVEHLVLVGDHKQLRPHCSVREFDGFPFNLNISLFERLVNNGVEYVVLNQQRRMNPEIRGLLKGIYGDVIQDHPSVIRGRPPLSVLGNLTSWFYTHEHPEERDAEASAFNIGEANMIYGLIQFLSYNGVESRDITVLTFYNGQRRKLNKLIHKGEQFWNDRLREVKLVTVDSYQGEENKYVLLSLVRSNNDNKIGFVGNENRVCVALSRAQNGLYIFGNATLLCSQSEVWMGVVKILHSDDKTRQPAGRRMGVYFQVTCTPHNRRRIVRNPEQWNANVGGCDLPCKTRMPCGHICKELCHPWGHDKYPCPQPCTRTLPSCGHQCRRLCSEPCVCPACDRAARRAAYGTGSSPNRNDSIQFDQRRGRDASRGSSPERFAALSLENGVVPPLLQLVPEQAPAAPRRDFLGGPAAWATFANGGALEQDRRLEREIEDQRNKERLNKLDWEQQRLLFEDEEEASDSGRDKENNDECGAWSTAKEKGRERAGPSGTKRAGNEGGANVKCIGEEITHDGNGKPLIRHTWTEKYIPSSQTAWKGKGKAEHSLLD